MRRVIASLFVVLLAVFLACGGAATPTQKADMQLQNDRHAFLQKLIKQGYVTKLEQPATLPHLWVTPKFMALDFQAKKEFCEVVFAYHYEAPRGMSAKDMPTDWSLVLKHSISGNRVGSYHPVLGLDF